MKKPLVYKMIPHGRLKVSSFPLMRMLSYQQDDKHSPESGGLLAGRYLLDCDDIVVDAVTVPMEGDIQERHFFQKDTNNHQISLKQMWELSKGTCNYIGEWHTHPEPIPTPSSHDLDQWKKVMKKTVLDHTSIFFVIVGTQSIRVWQGQRKTQEIRELVPEQEDYDVPQKNF